MSVSDSDGDTTPVEGGDASSESAGGESWLAEQVRLITLEEGFAP